MLLLQPAHGVLMQHVMDRGDGPSCCRSADRTKKDHLGSCSNGLYGIRIQLC